MASVRLHQPEKLSADAEHLIKILNKGSDFTVVLVGLSYLDACLTALLSKYFLAGATADDLLDHNRGPLGSLASKAKLAYVLGLLYKPFLQNVLLLAELRNTVAHSHTELNFDEPTIKALCARLSILTDVKRYGTEEPLVAAGAKQTPREHFILSCVVIWGHILARAEATERVSVRA